MVAARKPLENADLARRLRAWAVELALPLWARAGFDARLGGFHERLHWDGTPDIRASRRTVVQARQIYVYSHASVLGWYPGALEVALRALEFLLARCRSLDGAPGYVHSVAPDGSVADARRDTYDHAFILLALAWLARASGDAQVRALLDEALAFMDEHLAVGDGTFLEGLPPSQPRRQNPHMHLFEAMLALHQTGQHADALARAQALRSLLADKFLDPSTGALREYFTADWQCWPGPQGDALEPGHHAEWCWLLRTHDRLAEQRADPLATRLLDRAIASAEPATGFLIDETDASGAVRQASRRCWPQTELAKAWLAEHELGRAEAAPAVARALHGLMQHYLSGPIAGGWIDKFDAQARPLVEHIPGSTFYHLFCTIAEADRVLTGRTESSQD